MAKLKIKTGWHPPTKTDSAAMKKLDSFKFKLGQRVYVGDKVEDLQKQRDSLEIEVKKLKIEIKKK